MKRVKIKLIDILENYLPVENRFLCKVEGYPDISAKRDTSSCTVITVNRSVCQNEVILGSRDQRSVSRIQEHGAYYGYNTKMTCSFPPFHGIEKTGD